MTPRADTSTILIVDDTPSNLGVVVELFEDRGYRVAIAQDGEEGLQRAGLVQPDLILLDVMLPGADGFEVCRRLKADEKTRDIPVIFMTALAATEHKVKGFEAGGVDYVTKPLQIDEVMARVCTHLALHAAQQKLEAQNAQLENHREELERQVAERTAELRESNRHLMDEIAERRAAEKRLRMMDFALNRVREAAYLIEQQNLQFIHVNDEACRALGYSRDELLGMTVYDIDPDATPAVMAALNLQREGDGSFVAERRHKAKDGTVFPVEIQSTLFTYKGRPVSIALARDITERKAAERLLRVERGLFVAGPTVVFKWQAQEGWPVEYVSPNVAEQFGYAPEDLTGGTLPFAAIVHPDDLPRVAAEVTTYCAQGRDSYEQSYRIAHADGRYRWIYDFTTVVRGEDGAITHFLGYVLDITERMEVERRLEETRSRLLSVLQTIPDLVWLKDMEGIYLACNHAFERVFGAKEADIVGRTDYDFVDAELAGFFRGKDQAALDADRVCINEEWVTFAGADRQTLLETRRVPVHGSDGTVIGVLGIARDITERKQVEETLYAREQEFRAVVENSPDIIVRLDRACRRIYLNPAAEKLAGRPASELVGKTFLETAVANSTEEQVAANAQSAVIRVLQSGEPAEAELAWTSADGTRHHLLTRYAPEFGHDGEVASVLSIGRDIVALKEAEQRLKDSYAQLRELAARRESAREDERKRIAREMHDELGQFLTALRRDVSTLQFQFGEDNPALMERTEHTMELVDKTIKVVRNVVSSLRPAALEMGVVPALEWLAEKFSKNSGVPCTLKVFEADVRLADELAVGVFRIVQESLTNVARYADASKVEIAFERRGDEYVLHVKDDGKGFDPTVSHQKSFGLVGMRERVYMLGGQMNLSSVPGQGTTIAVCFPANEISGGL